MAERQLAQLVKSLQSGSASYSTASSALSKAKLLLLQLKALTPSTNMPGSLFTLARATYEQGALYSIRAKKADAFTRYVSQLEPFYTIPLAKGVTPSPDQNKITGLYLLLLLTQGRYGEFHSQLESLMGQGEDVESDKFLRYPVRLERWLMEGSYDQVWRAMKRGEAPCDEYGVFSEVCISFPQTISFRLSPIFPYSCFYTHSSLFDYRFSAPKYAAKSHHLQNVLTHLSPLAAQSPFSSLTVKAMLSAMLAPAAG